MAILSRGMKNQYVKEVNEALGAYSMQGSDVLTRKDIEKLPQPVQKYLEYTRVVGKPKLWNFRAEMGGKMRNDDKSAWMDIDSVQYNFFGNPVMMFYI